VQRAAAREHLRQDPRVASAERRHLGLVFNEVPELYDRVRPSYPDELFVDLAAITGMDGQSAVLEVGCGTGQATGSLARLAGSVTAVEPGADMAAPARERLVSSTNVEIEVSSFEEWDDRGQRFDVLVAASSWHWVDASIGWRRARHVLRPGGWMAVLGHVVVRRPGEPEVYAETADLHERFSPGHPARGDPPLEDEVRATDEGWGPPHDPPPACSVRRSSTGTRRCSGSTGPASPICSAPPRGIASSPPTCASHWPMRWPNASARGWVTESRAAT
jgi:SAM-dependent methyltransferase